MLVNPLIGFGVGGVVVVPGSVWLTSTDAAWIVPNFNEIVFHLYGGGASGCSHAHGYPQNPINGRAGGTTTIASLSLVANGGAGGVFGISTPGAGGTASGGDTNTTGGVGANWTIGGAGAGPDGGAADQLYGGGGSKGTSSAAAGGGGGYCSKTYVKGEIAAGASLNVVVGLGGITGANTYMGNNGRNGGVQIVWT